MKNTLFIFACLLGLFFQAFGQTPSKGLEGMWNGVLNAGAAKLRIAVTFTKSDSGAYAGKFESIDQGATIPIDTVTLNGDKVRFEITAAGIVYDGVLNKERTELNGTFQQGGQSFPLSFKRAEEAAAVPKPTPAPTPKPDYSAPPDAP